MKALNEAIIKIRVELQSSKLNKSGKNKFAGFSYYELGDFLPALNILMEKHGVNDQYTIENDSAILTLIKGEAVQSYKMPFTQFHTPVNKNGMPSMQDIQYLGALNTYYKRYLYLNAFGITDGEVIDALDKIPPQPPAPITTDQKNTITDLLSKTDSDVIKFYEVFRVKNIDEMTQAVAQQAINTLNIKIKKMEG